MSAQTDRHGHEPEAECSACSPRIYRIIRFRFGMRPRTITTGLTLTEAQKWCNDPETSSSTATKARNRRKYGSQGFDGYDYMRGCAPRGR